MGLLWGRTERMVQIKEQLEAVGKTSASILLTGPTGSGKDLLARFVHDVSQAEGPFLPINCAAIPENLLESLLFGHERGVFTGAFDRQVGLFERADKGTLFLDEIGCLGPTLQAKLLRVLQDMEFQRLGSHTTIKLSARIISATNENLVDAMKSGRFRQDLYYRLAVFQVNVPSLKSRLDDIPLLTHYFVEEFQKKYSLPTIQIDKSMLSQLKHYPWPGNIRELRAAVESGLLLVRDGIFTFQQLPETIRSFFEARTTDNTVPAVGMARNLLSEHIELPSGGLREVMDAIEKRIITQILRRHGGILNRAYRELGIPKPTLIQRARRLNIDVNEIKYQASR